MTIIARAITLEKDGPPGCAAKLIVTAHGVDGGVEHERAAVEAAVKSIRENCQVNAWSEIDGIGIIETTIGEMAAFYQSRLRMNDGRRVFAIDPEAARARRLRNAWLHGQSTALQGSSRGNLIGAMIVAGEDAKVDHTVLNPWKDRKTEFPHLHGAWESGFLEGMGEIQGMAAFAEGKARDGNPHVHGSPQWKGWDSGWTAVAGAGRAREAREATDLALAQSAPPGP